MNDIRDWNNNIRDWNNNIIDEKIIMKHVQSNQFKIQQILN